MFYYSLFSSYIVWECNLLLCGCTKL